MEEQERGEETEVDDDPARDRAVRAIGLTPDEHNGLIDRARARRRWEVVPLCSTAARRNSGLSSTVFSHSDSLMLLLVLSRLRIAIVGAHPQLCGDIVSH